MQGLTKETLPLLISLIPGFIAFRIFTIDKSWSNLNQINIVFGILSFSAIITTIVYSITQTMAYEVIFGSESQIFNLTVGCFLAVGISIFWRKFGIEFVHKSLRFIRITNEDHIGNTWQRIFNNPNITVTQIIAYPKNGDILMCEDTTKFMSKHYSEKNIPAYCSDSEGNLFFIATHSRKDRTRPWKELSSIDAGDKWGVRVTYLKKDDISRIDLRIENSGYIQIVAQK